MKESMTWNKEPSLSIDFCNRIEMEQNDLFKYVLENDLFLMIFIIFMIFY